MTAARRIATAAQRNCRHAARRARPVQTVHVLVALCGSSVLLQRRPPQGIWGGLMCLPQFETPSALKRAARALGCSGAALEVLPPRRHELTHLSLAIEPYRLRLEGTAGKARSARDHDTAAQRWFTPKAAEEAGMPVPHRRLLEEAACTDASRARAKSR